MQFCTHSLKKSLIKGPLQNCNFSNLLINRYDLICNEVYHLRTALVKYFSKFHFNP